MNGPQHVDMWLAAWGMDELESKTVGPTQFLRLKLFI